MHSNGHGLFQLNVQYSPVVSNPVYVVRISMIFTWRYRFQYKRREFFTGAYTESDNAL